MPNPPAAAKLKTALEHHQHGRLEQAEPLYREVLAADPKNAPAMHYLGLLLHKRGENEEALKLLEESVRLDSKNAVFLNNLGGVQRLIGKFEEARKSFERALSWQPQLAQAHYNLGLTLGALGQPDAALNCFRRTISYQPRYPDALFQIGAMLAGKGEMVQAAEQFERAIAVAPDHTNALTASVDVYTRMGAYDRAAALAQKMADRPGPDQQDWVNQVGVLYNKMSRPADALRCFDRAIEISPNLLAAWINRGNALEALGRKDEAIASLKRALEIDPESNVAKFSLAVITGSRDTTTAPPEYVSKLFDEYAENFDFHLVNVLKYSTPQRVRDVVAAHRAGAKFDIMDLGCGTGLSGEAFKEMASSLVGVDLSAGMLEKAQARGLYRELICGDMGLALRERPAAFDLVLACDVFVYVGDLAEVFAATISALRPGGLFAFSVEALDEEGDYLLRATRRYAQSANYIRRLASSHGLAELDCRRVPIRFEQNNPVQGYVFLLRKSE
jgi:predicted TPR repeat methyltransferase